MSKKKILLITDDIRSSSGVGNVGRELVINTSHIYDWVQIAGALKHPDKGKKLDLSENTNKIAGIDNASVILYPTDGYGDKNLLREVIKEEEVDALLLLTDPRYFTWIFQNEYEIRRKIPIIYLNIWDNIPAPHYNLEYYKSCDLLLGISKLTKLVNRLVLEEGNVPYFDLDNKKGNIIRNSNFSNPIMLKYLPHGRDENIFKPLPEDDKILLNMLERMDDGKDYEFTLFFNSRNMNRKALPDTIMAWKGFLNKVDRTKCRFILHTEPSSNSGTDIVKVIETLFPEGDDNIVLSSNKLSNKEMNALYNIADGTILASSQEGWGLSLTESLLAGTPIIANVTGGMQDQMRFEKDGKWFEPNNKLPTNSKKGISKHGEWVYPIFPNNTSLIGSPPTPYIFEDKCSIKSITEQIYNLYKTPKEERIEKGKKGREWVTGDEAGFTSKIMSERFIEAVDYLFENWIPRKRFNLYVDKDFKKPKINHNLTY